MLKIHIFLNSNHPLEKTRSPVRPMKYRPLMILGTGSDVGKSIVVAALCRIFYQEGVRVAPFKAQNMALNSFITPEGGEMGRAQVVQAQAAGLAPHVDMNPVLLKPVSDVGSQVIVHGRVYGNFNAKDYYRREPKLVRQVMASYRRLSGQYELIILEGAGSAAELNLKNKDMVNFSMAKRAGAAVLLTADIERVGVFAATIGTYHLLTPSERRLLEGFIINKFRGDPALFEDGARIIEKKTGRPVLGVLPYIRDMAIPQEDSVALERRQRRAGAARFGQVQIGVVKLPHISNYTDFDPFEQEPAVQLHYLNGPDRVEDLDLLILPGTKNTIGDLLYLKQTGMSQRIDDFARGGGRIIGICGGYQILGEKIADPFGMEGEPREEKGLGLLPVITSLDRAKTTTQVKARETGLYGSHEEVGAYEIHMGETRGVGPGGPAFVIFNRNGRPVEIQDGWTSSDRRIWGAYLHGVFDNDNFRKSVISEILQEKGISAGETSNAVYHDFLEAQFDNLADVVRSNLDMNRIRSIIQS